MHLMCGQVPEEAKMLLHGGSCESPDVSAGNQTQVPRKTSKTESSL